MRKGAPKVFIDTNVWFSSIHGSLNCEKLVNAHIDGKITAVISHRILKETIRNLKIKLPGGISIFEQLVKEVPPQVVRNPLTVSAKVKQLADDKDQLILQSAINAKVKVFVTGNLKDFRIEKIKKVFEVEILNPKQAVKKLKL